MNEPSPGGIPLSAPRQFKALALAACGLMLSLAFPVAHAQAAAHAVWATVVAGGIDVQYAHQQGQTWSSPQSLANGTGVNITPALTSDAKDNAWVAWIERGAAQYALRYNRLSDGAVSASGTIPTPSDKNYAPTMLVDAGDVPWVAWSSYDGQDEDIYVSHWNGSSWSSAMRVHDDNAMPDSLPVLGLNDSGQVWISWKRLQDNAWYTMYSVWDGSSWSTAQLIDDAASNTTASDETAAAMSSGIATTASSSDMLPAMPAQAAGRIMGAINVPGAGQVQSLSDRIAPLRTEE